LKGEGWGEGEKKLKENSGSNVDTVVNSELKELSKHLWIM